jgi:hypothetical protein
MSAPLPSSLEKLSMHARPRDGRLGSRSVALLALALATAASCSSGGSGGTTGSGGSTSAGTGGTTSTGGTTGTGGSNAGSGGTTSSTGGTNVGTGGVAATGGATGSGGASTGGTGGHNTGTGGSNTGGSTGSGGTTGSGGAAGAKGTGGTTGTGGASTGGATGSGGSTGTAGTSGCPSNATFCSGFEAAGLPTGAIYMINGTPGDWSRDFAIDTTQHHAGASSLLVKDQNASGSSGSGYRMLAVPATPNAFWVRFWIMGGSALGTNGHNAYAGASIGNTPNDLLIEFAEDVGIAFNTSDSDQWPTGYGRLSGGGTKPYILPAMTWECIEISYDGTGREQQLFINNVQLIDAKGYPANTEALTYFKFGYDGYNGAGGSIWYDDVAVAPARIGGCPTVAMSNQ